MEDSVTLDRLVRWYEAAEQATEDSRVQAETWRDYRNGEQWSDSEIAALNKRKQPIVTIDRIGPKVDFLMGMEAQNRAKPKAHARTPKHEQDADAATDALRYVVDAAQWDQTRSESFDSFIVEGACGVDLVYQEEDSSIAINPIMWDRMFWDPHSRKRDFSDAKYLGQFVWMDLEEALERWPGKKDALEATMAHESSVQGQTFDDVPRLRWADPKRKRVRVASCYSREGGLVYYSAFTKAGILERMESPYRDERGIPMMGFVFGSCYVDRDGNRFGVVKRWISIQDEINKRRSKAMHLLNVRQVKAEKGAVDDVNRARAELARPDGFIEVTPGMVFEPLETGDMAEAQFQLLQHAEASIDSVGVNAALSGTEDRNMSGRALLARQEQGLNELGPVFDWFKSWQLQVYRAAWAMVRQFWTAEKWVRVTDDEDNVRFVGLNQPLTLGEQILERMKSSGVQITPDMQEQARTSEALAVVVGVKNAVAEMDVDITIDAAPAPASLQIEQFQALADLAGKGVPIPPDMLIEASSLRNKEKIIKAMKGDFGDAPPQMVEALKAASAEIEALRAELEKAQQNQAADIAKEQIKGQVTKEVESEKRQTELAKAQLDASVTERIAVLNARVEMLLEQMQQANQRAQAMQQEAAGRTEKAAEKPAPQIDVAGVIQQVAAALNPPKRKTMQIQAPSGQVYTGSIDESVGNE